MNDIEKFIQSELFDSLTEDQMPERDVFKMARAFLSIESMTHKKLEKLCYYAKAWYLAFYGDNIISDNFEAWVHGAVQPSLYQKYKCYGFQLIPMCDSTGVEEEYLEFAKTIYKAYGRFSGEQLEALNHQEDPWKNARQGLEPWENCNQVISENDMKIYYRSLIKQ